MSAAFDIEGLGDPSAIALDRCQPFKISPEPLVGLRAVLETLQIRLQFNGTFRGQAVDHPIRMAGGLDQAALA